MKIGYDYTQPSQTPGGCGWHAHSLLVEMARLAPEAEFLAYRHFAGLFIHPEERLAPLPPLPNIRDPLAGLSFDQVVKTWNDSLTTHEAPGAPDIVHSLLFQAPAQKNAKLVVTVFDLGFWVHPEFTTEGIRSGCQRGILDALENADGLIFSSEHSRQEFDRLLPSYRRKGKIPSIVTPLGCRYTPISQEAAAANAARHGDYWLFVGSMEPRKNLVGLLNAYESYAAGHPAPKPLHFVGGSGWKNEEIRSKLAPLEARGLVKHLGVVADEDLPKIYQNAEGFLFPSWYEGFGLPVLEAMSQGCPVISSDRSSLPEVGGDAVMYINPAEPGTIADTMRRIEAEPELRAKLIYAGLAQAAKFSWEKAARQTLAFYEQVLASPSGTGLPQSAAHNTALYTPKAPLPLANTPQRSFLQKWFPTPKKNQERIDALEAELILLHEQRFTQLEGNAAATAAALEQRFTQLESNAAALSLATRSLLPELEKHMRTLVEQTKFPSSSKISEQADKALDTVQAVQSLEADAFYSAFEARFRGPHELITKRQSYYLPHIAEARRRVAEAQPQHLPVITGPSAKTFERLRSGQGILDLGSGRGEWLELLGRNGIPAVGVELNQIFLKHCHERSLDVIASDVIACLTAAPSESVAVVTGFHIIEHLPFPVLQEFVRQSHRVLCPGGIAIFETPNPRNMLVSAVNFWSDPTHLHPVNPDFIEFLLEDSGFAQAHVEFLNPLPPLHHVGAADDPLAQRFNEFFYGPQDFAVIGTKRSA